MNDELFEKLLSKQDEIIKELQDIKIIQAKQEENLRYHIYRTELAEENIEILRTQVAPIETHVKHITGILKFLGALAVFSTFIVSIIQIIKFLG